MSQGALEAALGRLICDDTFRRDFYRDAEVAAAQAGFRLTWVELGSLRNIDLQAVERFVTNIDDRIRRAEERLSQANRVKLVRSEKR